MSIFTLLQRACFIIVFLAFFTLVAPLHKVHAQASTSWKGTTSSSWFTGANWTNGLPGSGTNAVIGDSNFTGPNQPVISGNSTEANCLSLVIGGGARSAYLLVDEAGKGLKVSGDVMINSNGSMHVKSTMVSLAGNWINNGVYSESLGVGGNSLFAVDFTVTDKAIGGTSITTFGYIRIYGSINLEQNIHIKPFSATVTNGLYLNGTLNPQLNKVTWESTTSTNDFYVNAGATLKVMAPTFSGNYAKTASLNPTGIVEYAASTDQEIEARNYGVLKISGSGVKSLVANTSVSSSYSNTELLVSMATLDLKTFTLNRNDGGSVSGGILTIANGAKLRIGGTGTFPTGYQAKNLGAVSTVEYYGANQTVQSNTYGHLILSGSGVKTMPVTSMTIKGNLSSAGTVAYTAGAALTVEGNVTIGAGTTFTGGTHAHTLLGNWINSGAFNHGNGTVTLAGSVNTSITGATTFYTLALNKASMANTLTLNSDITVTNLQMTSGEVVTGASKVVLLGDRTGSGWVTGTLTRSHTFVNGTAYAFNGAHAKLTFTGGMGVTQATMVTGVGSPSGFVSGKSISRMYQVSNIMGSYTGARVQLQYIDSELNGCLENGLKLYRAAASTGIWKTTSRNANSTTDNWAAMDGFTDVTGFWTLTDNPSTFKWKGATSIAWETGSNWEVTTDGETAAGTTPPLSSDYVILGEIVPTSQPSINSAVTIKGLSFAGNNQMALSVGSGSLGVTENIEATGTGTSKLHTLTTNNNSLSVGGNLVLGDGSGGNNISLVSSSGSISVSGSITQPAGASVGLGSGTLSIGGNYTYTSGASFTPGTSTVIYNGTGTQTVAGLNYHILQVSAGGVKALAGNATVQNKLELTNGRVNTGNNRFILGASATITESAANYVTGFVETQRTMTTAMETFGNLGLAITPAISPGTVTVVRETGRAIEASSGNTSILRNFSFTTSGTNSGLDATVTFGYFEHELGSYDENTLQLFTSSDGATWKLHGSSVADPAGNRVGATGVGSLQRMTLGSSVSPLPVELAYFKADKKGNDAILTWATTSEEGNKGFEVEVSLDGVNYIKLGFVSHGTTALRAGSLYTYTDKEAGKTGIRYYRLKQIDLDGKYTYYGPRSVTFGLQQAVSLVVFPNPVKDQMQISFNADCNGTAKAILYTTSGKRVHEGSIAVQTGENIKRPVIDLQNLKAGLYLLIIEVNGTKQSIKVVKE